MMSDFQVGQKVIVAGVNMRSTFEAEVVKVGRTLVYVEQYGLQTAYRKDTGVINDNYGHVWIQTPDDYRASQEHAQAVERLRDLGLVVVRGYGSLPYSTATLTAVCKLLEAERP